LPVESAVAALQAALILGALPPAAVVADIFARVSLAGRFQRLVVAGRRLVLDVAHNPAAAAYLAKRLAAEEGRVVAVAALMADKDRAGFVTALSSAIDHWYLGELADNPRACPAGELAAMIYNAGGSVSTCATVAEALSRALEESRPDDLVVVCGSFHTVGAAIATMEASTEARKEILSP
jgi:dihydrofolate synthase/folylpolyglutamate synthase